MKITVVQLMVVCKRRFYDGLTQEYYGSWKLFTEVGFQSMFLSAYDILGAEQGVYRMQSESIYHRAVLFWKSFGI